MSTSIPKTVNGLSIILGMGNIGDPNNSLVRFPTAESAKDFLAAFAKRGYRQLDSARNYPPGSPETAEPVIGEAIDIIKAEGQDGTLREVPFIIDTKLRHSPPNTHSTSMVEKSISDSLRDLHSDKVHIEYLHSIDETSNKEETCRALDEGFRAGKLDKFGLCNATVTQLDEFFAACEAQQLTLRPSVYQGDYNILTRGYEDDGVFDRVRHYGMPFYAHSPAAGGLLNPKAYRERTGGRFDKETKMGQSYHECWYVSTPLQTAAQSLRDLSETHGIAGHHLALRWIAWHSALSGKHNDGIILGASSIEQLNSNLDALEAGPLPEEVANTIEKIWETLKKSE